MTGLNGGHAQRYFLAHLHDVTDECMIWPYTKDRHGYGQMIHDGRRAFVHTLACAAHNGPRPPGTEAAHGPCHNTSCWNGRHLTWKTHAENLRDKARDGTQFRGETHPGVKIQATDVVAIRERAQSGEQHIVLAVAYGISAAQVSRIVSRKRWAHL